MLQFSSCGRLWDNDESSTCVRLELLGMPPSSERFIRVYKHKPHIFVSISFPSAFSWLWTQIGIASTYSKAGNKRELTRFAFDRFLVLLSFTRSVLSAWTSLRPNKNDYTGLLASITRIWIQIQCQDSKSIDFRRDVFVVRLWYLNYIIYSLTEV